MIVHSVLHETWNERETGECAGEKEKQIEKSWKIFRILSVMRKFIEKSIVSWLQFALPLAQRFCILSVMFVYSSIQMEKWDSWSSFKLLERAFGEEKESAVSRNAVNYSCACNGKIGWNGQKSVFRLIIALILGWDVKEAWCSFRHGEWRNWRRATCKHKQKKGPKEVRLICL